MAFEDSLIGSDDFDPQAATEALIRQQSTDPLPVTLDPRMLNTRLARKLAQPGETPAPVEMPSVTAPSQKAAPDFSAQGIEPAASINTQADFSAEAAEPPMIGPQAAPATNNSSGGLSDYPIEFGKGVLEGGKNMGASALKGTAALGIPSVADTGLLDELNSVKDKTPSQRAKLMGRVLREVTDRGLQMDYNAALRRVSQGADAKTEIEALKPKFEANNKSATEPVTDKPLYKAGQAVEDFGKEALAPRPGFEPGKSWTRDIGSGAGSMVAGIGTSMIPGIGPYAAGAMFTASGMGEAAEKAVKEGATNDQIRRATMLGGVAGATDLVDALIPMLGSTGRTIGFLKRMGLAAVKGAIMEGGQEGVQQLMQNAIAKGIYKPDQDLMEDVPRSVAIAAILGGVGGGISGAATRDHEPAAPGLAPPPGGGAAPGTGPSSGPSGPQSSPEDIADFVRKARESAPPPEPDSAGQSPPDPASMSEAERMHAYAASRESHDGASETEILKAAGLDPAAMDEQKRIDAVIRATKSANAGSTADSNAPGNAGASSQQEAPKADETEASHLRYAVLREYGYSDEDIDNMSAGQRGREFNDAIAEGIKPGAAMSKHPKRAKPKPAEAEAESGAQADPLRTTPTSESDVGTANKASDLPGAFGAMGKAMGDNLRSMLWDRVQKGETTESSTGGQSALMQGAKMIRARGGLKTRAEFDAYATEHADTVTAGAPTFQQDMRALVDKHSPKGGDGTRAAPSRPHTAEDVRAAQAVEPKSPAQAEAENYKHAHIEMPQIGLVGKRKISVETGVGQERKGIGEDGKEWSVKMEEAAYGRIGGTQAADFKPDGKTRQNLDIFIGPHPTSEHVFVIDQHKPGGEGFDEHKIMAGFRTPVDALHAYARSYNDHGGDRIGHVTAMDAEQFQSWLDGDTTKPLKPASPEPVKAGEAGLQAPVTSAEASKETPAATGARDDRSAQKTTKPATRSNDEPLSLLQFIASKGGLAPHAELDALDIGDRRVQIPGRKGFFGIIRPTGMSLDNMREAAEEADYLKGETNKTSTIRNLLDAMDVELRGGDHRAAGDEGKSTKKQRTSAAESSAAARDKAIAENVEAIQAEYAELPEGLAEQAATIMADELLDLDSAVEMAAVRAVNEDEDYEITENNITATYGEGAFDAIQTRSAPSDGGAATPASDQEQRSEEGEEAVADGKPDADAREEGGEDQGEVDHFAADREALPNFKRGDKVEFDQPGEFRQPDGSIKEGRLVQGVVTGINSKSQGVLGVQENGKGDWSVRASRLRKQAALPAVRNDLFVEIAGKRLPLTSYEDASRAYSEAVERTGATASGRTGPQAPQALIKDAKGNPFGYISYNGRVWKGDPKEFDNSKTELLYDPSGEGNPYDGIGDTRQLEQASIPGTEPISQGEQAQRKADERLKPKVAQKPADDGLFGDTMDQADLLDAARTPDFLYHGTGKKNRASILKSGLMQSESDAAQTAGDGTGSGIYFTTNAEAENHPSVDVWKVDVRGLDLQDDDTTEAPAGERWFAHHEGDIPPSRLTLLRGEGLRGEPLIDLDGATADIQAGDSDETVTVTLSRSGPWDFNDTWPAPDMARVAAAEKEGRSTFGEGQPDVEQVVGVLDEGMNAIMSAIAEIRAIDTRMADIRSGKTKLKKKQTVEKALEPLQRDRKQYAAEVVETADAYEDAFGRKAANAMIAESRRRLRSEEGSSPGVRARAPLNAIETALGEDLDKVAPVDIARAAEIMAEHPGMTPETAFGQAVIVNAVEQGLITEQQAEESYGLEVKAVLDAERARAPVSGSDDVSAGGEPAEDQRDNAASAGELPGGSEAGKGGSDTAAQDFQFDDAGRVEPDTGGQAGDIAADQGAGAAEDSYVTSVTPRDFISDGEGKQQRAAVILTNGQMLEFSEGYARFGKWNGLGAHARFREEGSHENYLEVTAFADKSASIHGADYATRPQMRSVAAIKTAAKRIPGFDLTVAYMEERSLPDIQAEAGRAAERDAPTWAEILHVLPMSPDGRTRQHEIAFDLMTEITGDARPKYADLTPAQRYELMDRLVPAAKEPIIQAGDTDGIPAPVHAGDAPAGPEDVQPVEPGGQAGGVRDGEGNGSEQAVPRADSGRTEGAGRVSEGAAGERSDRAGNVGDARLSEPRADDAASGRAKRAIKRAADNVEGENFTIEPGSLDEGRGQKAKARDNIRAIELVGLIESEGRPATAAEQADLAKYVGWGGIKNIFPDSNGKFGEGFDELGARLRDLLLDTEYDTARRSIQYAHYTSEDIVRSMWSAVTKMGFDGGQVFEPGMGVGNFAGMMPGDVAANSHYSGIELDHTTARIAKLLYPKWGVRQDDFTKTALPENNYDVVIGNPPFADVPIKSDPKYKQGFLLHDYFFAKSIDAVRPGGLLAFVTSAGTMNKLDTGARDYLADRADLVGAIRLPGDAFKKNAGTEVTTDIIFLRKRLPTDIPGDRSWTQTAPVSLPGKDGEAQVNVNSYFIANPGMVLGKQDANDKLYPGRYSVKADGRDFKAALDGAIDSLPAGIMSPWQGVQADHTEQDFSGAEKKEGTYYVGPNGALFQMTDGIGRQVGQRGKGVENGRTAADMDRIKGLIPVRDALRAVYAADLAGEANNADTARAALNKNYDAFVNKFGPINKAVIQTRRPNVIQMESARAEAREEARYANERFREGDFDATRMLDAKTALSVIARARQDARDAATNKGLIFDEGDFDPDEVPDVIIDKRPNVDPFMDDPESYRLRAIERYDEGTGTGHKSPVFSENIITRERVPTINSVNDALLYSLSQFGRVNIPEMARLAKLTDAEVIEKLGDQVFRQPGARDTFVTRDEYLSGNVRKKLALAMAAAEKNPDYRRNVIALEAAQPVPLAPSQIHATLGMPWIPADVISTFGIQGMGLEALKARYVPQLAQWIVAGDTDSVAASSTWGTPDRRAPALLQDALNRQSPKIYDKHRDENGREVSTLNIVKTEAAQDKIRAINERFSGWIWGDEMRADRLAGFYNENFNNLVVRQYDGEYLTTPGIASNWSWRPHQKRVIARIIQSGNTYVAHAVGAGKTSEYIGAIMEMRRLGLVRKPMVVVPNHMLAQFTKEWYEQYPTARLAIADDRRFHNDRRKQFVANVATDDLDAVIITHSAFGMIPVSQKFADGVIQREMDQYRELLAELKRDGGDSRITRSRVEKQIERLEQRLAGKNTRRRDAVFTFEEMGIDHLTVDEAHLFRKLDFSTQMSNLKGVTPEGSGMAWDLYVKTQYLDTIRPGRGLVMGSGTPITNTMAELYTLSRFMQPQALAERGLEKFDAWAGAFGESVSELEQDAAGNYKPVSRFAKFVNVAELSAMVRQVMDVVTSKQLEQYVTRPQISGGKRQMHLAEKSSALVRFQEQLAARMIAIQKRKGPPSKGDDIMLSVINDGRHAAIDMRLAGGGQSEVPSKLDLMVNNIFETWKATKRQKFFKVKEGGGYESAPAFVGPATQLAFTNLGLSGARGFSVPDYIRAELSRRGVPKNEIAYIYDYKSATAKQRLFNDMNEGKVRILIGSVAKMGVGTNVQKRLAAIHNMDPLWYPADDEQRNGRGIRQGNMNPEIAINDYSTKGTYDSTMWGMMAKKAKFIEGFFEGDPSMRDMDDLGESSQYEQAKALTTNDPRLIVFTELKQNLERANRRKTAFDSEVYNTRQRRARSKSEMEHYAQRIEDTKQDIAQRIDTRGDAFKATMGKKVFEKRAEFGEALFDRVGELEKNTKSSLGGSVKIAEVGGFPIFAQVRKGNLDASTITADVFMAINGNHTREISYELSSMGTVRSIEHTLHSFDDVLEEYQMRLAKAQKYYAESEAQAKAKFEGDAEIAELTAKVNDLAADLAKPVDVPAAAAPVESGEEIAQLSDMGATLTPAADEAIENISRMLTSIVRSIAGDIPEIKFHKGLIPLKTVVGYPAGMEPKAAGLYNLGTSLLQLALTRNAEQMAGSAFHESYHHIEDKLQTPQERDLMKAETPRLRQYIKGRTAMTDEQVDGLAGYEVRAIAFQIYAADRVAGKIKPGDVHIGVRRWFDRLMDLLSKIKNMLKGLGFTSYSDVFNKAYTGGFAGRAATGDAGIDAADLASLSSIYHAVADRAGRKIDLIEVRTQIQDKFIRVKKAEESVGGVMSAQSAYQAESLYYGRTGEQLERLEENDFDPLITDMKARDVTLDEMNDYLYAKHAPERNLKMDQINHPNLGLGGRDLRGRGSGMSDDEAQAIMDRINAAGKMADFEALERRVRKIIDDTRTYLVDAGLISQENADAWGAQYEHYVPLRGFDEATEDEAHAGRGQGFDTRARETQQAMGRLSKADGPLAYVMMQAEMAIVRGEKNKVGNAWLRFVRTHPDPARWSIDTPKTKRVIDPRTGLVMTVQDQNWYNDPSLFVTKVGGKPVLIRMEGRDGLNLARALKNMGTSNLNSVLRLMHTLTTTMARLATQWNPNFLVPNFARDVGEAFINLQAQDQVHFVRQFSKHLFPAIKGSFDALRGARGGRYADAFREFDKAGGRIRFFGLETHDDVQANIAKRLRRLDGGAVNNLRAAGEAAVEGLEVVSGAIENATRLAAYMAARDVGMSVPDSANLALNLTVNFTKKGELGGAIGSLYLFANASIQGAVRSGQALTHPRVRKAAYGLVAIGALAAMFSTLAGGDDDDGTAYYAKIKPYIRDKHLIVMWPKGYGHDGQYLKIPLPYAFSPFFVLGSRLVTVMLGKDKPGAAALAVLNSIAEAMNPLGEEGGMPFHPMSLLPSVFRPAAHISTNQNWTGNPLYPARDFEKNKPDSEQSFRSNSEFSKTAAREINKLGGGNPYKSSGWSDWHPGSIDHAIESLTGGLGKFVMDVAKTAGAIYNGDPFDATKAPIVRRFVGSAKDPQTDASSYYEAREEAKKNGGDALRNARKDRASGVNKDDAESFLRSNTNSLAGEQVFKNADAAMKPLRDQRTRIEADTTMDRDAKRTAIEGVTEKMRQIQNTARKRYQELKQGASP